MDKDLIEEKLYQIMNQFNERNITSTKFYSIILNKINPFYDQNGNPCKILLLMAIWCKYINKKVIRHINDNLSDF